MKRIGILLCVAALAAPLSLSSPGAAQAPSQSGANAKVSATHKVAMPPHQLTLYPNGRPAPRKAANSFTQHRFNQPTPIHNTFMAPGY